MLNWVNRLLVPINRYFSPGWTNDIPHFLWIFVTHKFSMRLRFLGGLSWPLHYLNPFCLELRCCSLTHVFGVVVLLKYPFQGHFLFGIWQHLFKHFDVFKLIHDPWYMINRPNTVVWKTSLYHDFLRHHASLSSVYCGLDSVLGGHLSTTTRLKKNNFSPLNVTAFLFGPIDVFLGKFYPISKGVCINSTF